MTGTSRRTLIAEVHACQGCGACLLTCPEHAIRPSAGTATGFTSAATTTPATATLVIDPDRCTGCGECVEVCPVDAIVLTEPEPEPQPEPQSEHTL